MSNSSKNASRKPILLMGWDAADWHLIEEMIGKGRMPNLEFLRSKGSSAYLGSLVPTLSPLLWTSVACGKRPHEHGILSFVEESAGTVQAVSSRSRQKPAIWNILTQAQLRSKVINWWPSHPVEAVNGEMIAQPFFLQTGGDSSHYVYPKTKSAAYQKHLDVDITAEQLQVFFPLHSAAELEEDPLVHQVKTILKRSTQQVNVALEALEPGTFDLGMVYFEALDQIKHLAIKYHPPQMEEVSKVDFDRYQHIVSAAYQWHDVILGSFLKRLGPEVNYLLISDHGFAVEAARQMELENIPAAPATEHRPFGVLLGAGPDIKAQATLFGASLLDLMPNILYHFNLPLGEDLEGRPWMDFWTSSHKPSFIPTWDVLFSHFDFVAGEVNPGQDMVQDLVDLGYWDDEVDDQILFIREEQAYNKALSLSEAHQYSEALKLCEQFRPKAQKLFRWYVLEARLRLRSQAPADWLQWYSKLEESWQAAMPLAFCEALAYLQKGDFDQALACLQALEEKGLESPVLFSEMGQALLLAGQLQAAHRYFEKAVALDPQSARALNGLAQVAFAEERFSDFEVRANQALALKFFQPQLHYLWALHYYHQESLSEAQTALSLCLQLAPRHAKAKALKNLIEGVNETSKTIIVSGFPRSGTSLMMALLQEVGVDILTDEKRSADAHNARGYFEWEPIKNLARGIEWPDTRGKAVKVIASLLPYLPSDQSYKVIWMDRPTVEVVLSQSKMRGEAADLQNFPFAKGQALEAEKQRIQNYLNHQPQIEWQSIAMQDCLENPQRVAEQLSAFLGLKIGREALQKVIDPKLRHQRIG